MSTEKTEIVFGINKIKLIEFHFVEAPADVKQSLPKNLRVRKKFISGIDQEREIFGILLDVGYILSVEEENHLDLVGVQVATEFYIKDIAEVLKINKDQNKYETTESLITTFLTIAYNNTRGILFSKTQGTYINKYYLPIENPKTLFEQYQRDMKDYGQEHKKAIEGGEI